MLSHEFINKEGLCQQQRVLFIEQPRAYRSCCLYCGATRSLKVYRAGMPRSSGSSFLRVFLEPGQFSLEWNTSCSVSISHTHSNRWHGFASCFCPLLGPAMYCLIVYSRSSVVKSCLAPNTTNSTLNR